MVTEFDTRDVAVAPLSPVAVTLNTVAPAVRVLSETTVVVDPTTQPGVPSRTALAHVTPASIEFCAVKVNGASGPVTFVNVTVALPVVVAAATGAEPGKVGAPPSAVQPVPPTHVHLRIG